MCGLVFLHDEHSPKRESEVLISEALLEIKHRGPDAQELFQKEATFFAHSRLSILDFDQSRQPMSSPDGRYTLVFNGEIYNFQALRECLVAKWVFRTSGDTEVLLAGLILEGPDFLKRMEGMWAFAFWDHFDRVLIASRDRVGKKPLYYSLSGRRFSCASELPALRKVSNIEWQEDIDSTADYFRYGYCLPGYTLWEGVFEVLPGHYLIWRPGQDTAQKCYWEFSAPFNSMVSQQSSDLPEQLLAAVEKRLIADVEVGAFLSGGIDSSLICAMAQSKMASPLKTFTIGFSESTFDESKYAKNVSEYIGTDHYCEVLDSWDEVQLEKLVLNHLGQPFADPSLLPTALVSEVAAKDVKVVLSGDGADEIFGGYQRYQALIILRWYSRLPKKLRRFAEKTLSILPETNSHHSRSWLKKAKLFTDTAARFDSTQAYIAPLLFHPTEYAKMFPSLAGRGHEVYRQKEITELNDLEQMLYSDTLVYLPQDILAKVDRSSMAFGLETRAPFLDHKIIELAFTRSANQHVRVGKGKKWLREDFSNWLPAQVWNRKKQGFGVPISDWFHGSLGEKFESLLVGNSFFSDRGAKNLLFEHRAKKRDNGYRLWMMYIYLLNVKSK